ncbi:hypothetical protein Ahy_A02g006031 isoform A [Arachis hypogaea]|uniref:alpha-1,2-Mannosidase n=1 Tax=Arachis hypogaea TaxID=3818 RepID=A0A445E921_ARAHY|nr:hypothetical protein Ahy_A02g006031 isoform A [Arachis hypogaea]
MSFDPLLLFLLSFDSLLVELLSLLIELRSSTPLLIELRSSLLVFITAGYCSIITARVFCEILVFGILLQKLCNSRQQKRLLPSPSSLYRSNSTSFTIGIIAKTTELRKPWQLEWETSNKGLKKWSGDGKNRVPLFLHSSQSIDSLDTLALLGDRDRFATSIEWIGKNIRFDINKTVSLFETTIRVLGGLLSAHLIVNDYATDEEHENKGKDESCEAAESGASEREDATDEI